MVPFSGKEEEESITACIQLPEGTFGQYHPQIYYFPSPGKKDKTER